MTRPRMPSVLDILAARQRLIRRLQPSPLVRSEWLSSLAGAEVWLKLESVQPTGAFKIRGAFNAMLRLAEGHPASSRPDVVTASAGNHGRAIALAARELGMRATVFTPRDAPEVKRAAIRQMGAELRDDAVDYDHTESAARDHAATTGAIYVSPYNDPDVIAGAGTIGLEIVEALPAVDTVIVPIGGGGLLSGIGLAIKAAGTATIIGVEASASTPFAVGIPRGAITTIDVKPSLADGLIGNLEPDTITFDLVRQLVNRLVAVEEQDLRHAIRGLAGEERLIVEGAGAAATAAVLAGKITNIGQRIVVLVTGGNIDLQKFAAIVAGGLT